MILPVVWWSLASFILGWVLGRTFLRIWLHKELDKLQAQVHANSERMAASGKKIMDLTLELQAMVQAAGQKK